MAIKKTRATSFTRILIMLLLTVAVYFGVEYFLSKTEAGQSVKTELETRVND